MSYEHEWVDEPRVLHQRVTIGQCTHCSGDLAILVWGEGIDSHIQCTECGEKEVFQ